VTADQGRHPDAERLAEYADGVLGAEARADIERHLADCADCRAVVTETMGFLEQSPAAAGGAPGPKVLMFRSPRRLIGIAAALAAAAALVLAVRMVAPDWFTRSGGSPELQELIAAVANEPTRPVDGRLSGGFKYAPPPPRMRGSAARAVSPDVRIAAAKAAKLAETADTPENRAALGVAYLVLGDVEPAVKALESAIAQRPATAAFHNDLAVAYLAQAATSGQPAALQRALAEAEAAIQLSPNLPEAWFNRALAKQQMAGDDGSGWRDYLQHDSGAWTQGAREQAPPRERPVPVFKPISQMASTAPQIRIQLFGTQTSSLVRTISTAFPAEFYADNVQCSATWVGDRAVITAAHCFPEETTRRDQQGNPVWSVLADIPVVGQVSGECRRPPQFHESDPQAVRAKWDWALCHMSDSPNVAFETVSLEQAAAQAGAELLITGFGSDMSHPGVVMRVGKATVTNNPSTQDMIRLCGDGLELGDSGGSTYAFYDPQFLDRTQISVNSAKDGEGPCAGQPPSVMSKMSLVTPLWRAADAIKQWHMDLNINVCGVHQAASGCRNRPAPFTVLTQ
jgi:hypothetical protein